MNFTKSECDAIADNLLKLIDSKLVYVNISFFTPSYYSHNFNITSDSSYRILFKENNFDKFIKACTNNLSNLISHCWTFEHDENFRNNLLNALDTIEFKYSDYNYIYKTVRENEPFALGFSFGFDNSYINKLVHDRDIHINIKTPFSKNNNKLTKFVALFNALNLNGFHHTLFDINSYDKIINILTDQYNNLDTYREYMYLDELAKYGKNKEWTKTLMRFISKFKMSFERKFRLKDEEPFSIYYEPVYKDNYDFSKSIAEELKRDVPVEYGLDINHIYKAKITFNFVNGLTYAQKPVLKKLIENYLRNNNIRISKYELNDGNRRTYLADKLTIAVYCNTYQEIGENKIVNFIPSMH